MGTEVRLVLYADQEQTARQAAEAAFERFRELDLVLSDYNPESEVRRLCAATEAGPAGPQPISADLCRVLRRSLYWSHRSSGAFDVTVGPWVRLWRRAARQEERPSPQRMREATRSVGYWLLVLDPAARTLGLRAADMRLDFGAIGKGDAADEALLVLRQHGITAALVDAGGDLVGMGAPPDRPGWVVEVDADPTRPDQPQVSLTLTDGAVATSGDAWQFVELDGVRYSHVVDPRTGLGVVGQVAASVLAPSGADADAVASALCVMGVEAGMPWVEGLTGVEARLVVARGGRWEVHASSGWPDPGPADPGLATGRDPRP